ncbi:CRISPR system precrRNA processing endoribonuclease RAMP protein Cas6 [Azotobacter vinelandii]|uniref:CRISPR system precrRNA processing endoribonuclease RAMP protein Cas6 n=1 Tax=Azotobacter vinelandii TaxID=354 RepID=UPI0026655BEB|nr:CRISPR system precrRNA processing endoribonuclease RAMP protein Cas6 [Azotobacter vinelandii]WKN24010.1 CRISPR system precrRNA processing endoribonuclease RAMP protein Cas6 [Azotobacter vinelandii]
MNLPVARYHFRARTRAPLRLPDYAGSQLRGAFGHALRRIACMTRLRDCGQCPLQSTCPYPLIFEAPGEDRDLLTHAPNPFVIEPPPAGARLLEGGESFDFAMVLIGQALPQLPLIVLAWESALAQGLGKERSRCELLEVHCEDDPEPVYRSGCGRIREHRPQPAPPPTAGQPLRLRLLTPMRLRKDGRCVGRRELDASTLLIALARRTQALRDRHCPGQAPIDFRALADHAATIGLEGDLRWFDWTRYSSRQQREMTLGGLIGELRLTGDLDGLLPLLHLGQWLHLGKNATFGLGHYRMETL